LLLVLASRALRAQQDPKDQQALQARQDQRVPKAQQDPKDQQDRRAQRVKRVKPAP
jgi:hypothetical protein